MGKDLKGKELGVGISQRKDGLYTARITDSYGKRVQKYFLKLQECRKWIADAQFQKEHGTINAGADMTVDAWFEYWMENIKKGHIRESTKRSTIDRYKLNIKEYIGDMAISEVKPMHCQNLLNQMGGTYSLGSVKRTRTVLHSMFESAEENGLVPNNPVKKSVKCHSEKNKKEARVMSLGEQKLFLESSKKRTNHILYAFALQTGMRMGELTGLRWDDIDFESGILTVGRTMTKHSGEAEWTINEPKTESGKRTVPLTDEAVRLLREQKTRNKEIKVVNILYKDLVFLTMRGNPISRNDVDRQLLKICEDAGIERISMHTLRHTFATRCIEAGMKPKVLQKILGHANINMTMNLYVHATEDEKEKEIRKVEVSLKVV